MTTQEAVERFVDAYVQPELQERARASLVLLVEMAATRATLAELLDVRAKAVHP
jgi:hypothetical protein